MNEPHAIKISLWNSIIARVFETIRSIDKNHWIIVGGADWNSTAAEGTMEALLKEYKEMKQAVIPYFSTALEKHFRPFCLDPESLKFSPVSTQVGYAGILNYEGDDYEEDDWDEDEE